MLKSQPPSLLEYSTIPPRMTKMLAAAWISLLALASLTIFAGLVGGGRGVYLYFALGRMFPDQTPMLETILIVGLVELGVGAVVGTVQLICSLLIRRFSLRAMICAIIMVGLELVFAAGVFTMIATSVPRENAPMAVYGIVSLALGAVEYLLLASLPALRRARIGLR